MRLMTFALVFFAACGGPATFDCPDSPATFEANIQPLVARSCLPCHSESVVGANRQSAPREANYDSFDQVAASSKDMSDRINGRGNRMPPLSSSTPKLSTEEARLFVEWTACGKLP